MLSKILIDFVDEKINTIPKFKKKINGQELIFKKQSMSCFNAHASLIFVQYSSEVLHCTTIHRPNVRPVNQ